MKVVLDTNIIISPFLSPKGTPAKIINLWEQNAFELIVSDALLSEYQEVLGYPKVMRLHKMESRDIVLVVQRLRKFGILVIPSRVPNIIRRDPDDNQVLAAAEEGKADYIVTKDKDILDVIEYKGIQILKPIAFFTLFSSKE